MSIVFHVLERVRFFYRFQQFMSVLYMRIYVWDLWVEYPSQRILAQKQVSNDSHHFCILEVHPEASQVSYCADWFFNLLEFFPKVFIIDTIQLCDLLYFFALFRGERNNSLPIVFGNVFGFVSLTNLFKEFLLYFFTLSLFILFMGLSLKWGFLFLDFSFFFRS